MSGDSHEQLASLELTFLGQMGCRIQSGDTVVYIDPFLSDHPRRRFPSPLAVQDLCDADLILGSHDHKDHIDRAAWPCYAQRSPDAVFVIPEFLLGKGLAEDLQISSDRFFGLTVGQRLSIGHVHLTGLASAHEFMDQDEETGLFPYLGFIIQINGFTVYHAGDTCRYEGLETSLQDWSIDVMILPINGRDAIRYASGCSGNMTYQEAVDLAGSSRPGLVIPGHFDLFAHNAEDPQKFGAYMQAKYPDQVFRICEPGERVLINA